MDDRYTLYPQEQDYPSQLRQALTTPPVLYVRGNGALLQQPSLAIIGSRRATPHGLAAAELVATVAAQAGITVVSGGARGCDAAAGSAALRAGGKHIIVAGCGADVVYPKSSSFLFERTLESGGSIVSLDAWGTPPRRFAFPRRNRIIAALAESLFIAEAALPSGTFSTAEAAQEMGREVLAAPGSIFSPESRGTNYLISCGATCLIDEESIEVAISRIYGTLRYSYAKASDTATSDTSPVIAALRQSPLHLDEIASVLHVSATKALESVAVLEASGSVERLMDGRFALTTNALHQTSRIMHNRSIT